MEREIYMREDRKQIIDILKKMKNNYGVTAIKAEFEAEGSRKDELIMLREMVYQADLGFIIKIGGCEAVHDLDQCKLLDATGVMAPMIETEFAMKKFKSAAQNVYKDQVDDIEWIINAETKTCLTNFNKILTEGKDFLKGVTVGRSDLSASMGIDKKDIDTEAVYKATNTLIIKSREQGLITNFGGGIGFESIPFILKLADHIDRFETRKVIINSSLDREELKLAIRTAFEFELVYLSFKSCYYNSMAIEDISRINRLKKQLGKLD